MMTPYATAPVWTLRRALIAFANETVKGLRHGWSERWQILIEMPLFVTFVLLLGYTVGGGQAIATTGRLDWTLDPRQASWLFLGLAAFTYVYLHVQKMFWRLLAEIQSGTLEQTYLSPMPSWVHVVAGRVLAAIAETVLVVAATFAATSLAVRLDLHWHTQALIPLALLVLGAAGLALMVAGLTLVWKRIMMLNDLILLAVMFFSAAVLPAAELPTWAQTAGTPLFMTHAVDGLRTVLLDQAPIPLSGHGGLLWMLGTAIAWFLAGLVAFRLCERHALRTGTLTHV